MNMCRVFWGSHGCKFERDHDGPHICECCKCTNHPDDDACVGAPPYYGVEHGFAQFYGEDVNYVRDSAIVAGGATP